MKNVSLIASAFVITFAFAAPATAQDIPVGNAPYVFEAGAFESVDGRYLGEINVAWRDKVNKTALLTWDGNAGEVIVTPYTLVDDKQRSGVLGINIQQTVEEQTVVFTLRKADVTIIVPALHAGPISFDVLRTGIDPGYYFSGALLDVGVTLTAAVVDRLTFDVKARVTEANGAVEVDYGCNRWDPSLATYDLGGGWARWNVLDAYVTDAHGNRVERGNYIKIDIHWNPRSEPSGSTGYCRYEVPGTRAGWYRGAGGYFGYASIALDVTQVKDLPGLASATYVQGETRHDPLFAKFAIEDFPGGYKYGLYTPTNASAENRRPMLVWFHGTGERYNGANAGANIVANRVLWLVEEEFQQTLGGAFILAPQSTTAGFDASRVPAMDALISAVVAANNVDPSRIYVGGLSMGSFGMVSPMISSTNADQLPYAAAILVAGASISATQAQTVARKGIPVWLLGNAGDPVAAALFPVPTAYGNLVAAGVDARMKMYPPGPTFDGEHYYGAHDTWIYFYRNMVMDDVSGETMFDWLARQSR